MLLIETEKGQMSLRDVDYQLQTVKIDLIYTLLYINKRFISYFCKCIVAAAQVVVTNRWRNRLQ